MHNYLQYRIEVTGVVVTVNPPRLRSLFFGTAMRAGFPLASGTRSRWRGCESSCLSSSVRSKLRRLMFWEKLFLSAQKDGRGSTWFEVSLGIIVELECKSPGSVS